MGICYAIGVCVCVYVMTLCEDVLYAMPLCVDIRDVMPLCMDVCYAMRVWVYFMPLCVVCG